MNLLLSTASPAHVSSALMALRSRLLMATAAGISAEAWRLLAAQPKEVGLVRSVPDGDGLKLVDGRRVRYLGLDAPEVTTMIGQPEPLALAAKALNRRLVAGKRVLLVSDTTVYDLHDRLLRYVFCRGLLVNAVLLLAGLARSDVRPPDTRLAELLAQCQDLGK